MKRTMCEHRKGIPLIYAFDSPKLIPCKICRERELIIG